MAMEHLVWEFFSWNNREENGGIAQIAILIHLGLPEVDIDSRSESMEAQVNPLHTLHVMGSWGLKTSLAKERPWGWAQVVDGDPVLRPLCQRCPFWCVRHGDGARCTEVRKMVIRLMIWLILVGYD